MKKTLQYILLSLVIILTFSSCEKVVNPDDDDSSENVYWFVDTLMHSWYYWFDQSPNIDYTLYSDPQELMDALMVSEDKWSFIDETEDLTSYFEEGLDYGFGFYLGWDESNQLRVIISYNNTTAYKSGIRRGWILNKIDDVQAQNLTTTDFSNFFSYDQLSMEFEFITPEGTSKIITLSKEYYNLNAVFKVDTFNISNGITGYLSYQSFLKYSKTELDSAITILQGLNITDLIVDLRYNSGGYNSIAGHFANMLVPEGNEDATFYKLKHNDIIAPYYDTTISFSSSDLNLNLNRIFFLTNSYTASASELVINGLTPYMDVLEIGDTTSGKPYSMYGFEYKDWLAYPVCAHTINANDYGEYADGIVPNTFVIDNFAYDWGEKNDLLIQQALNYINNGNFLEEESESLKNTPLLPYEIKGKELFGTGLSIIDK